MSTWNTVALCAGLAIAFAGLLGIWILRLPFWLCVLAAIFMFPCPILNLGGRGAYMVFLVDGLAVALVLYQILNFGAPSNGTRDRRKVWFAALLFMLILPWGSSMLDAIFNPAARYWTSIWVSAIRTVAYLAVFRFFLEYGSRMKKPDSYLLLQALIFIGICVFGLLQFSRGMRLDLFNEMVGSDPSRQNYGYGGGFMGLYRGTAGVWGACILGMLPVLFLPRRGWNLLLPFATLVIAGCLVGVGSRQGVMFGGLAFCLGTIYALRCMPKDRRFSSLVQFVAAMLVLGVGTLIVAVTLKGSTFQYWVEKRFSSVTQVGGIGDLFDLAMSRDPKYARVWENITNSTQVFTVGMGYGREYQELRTGQNAQTYIDSELLYFWQIGGLLLIGAYFYFLMRVRLALRHRPLEVGSRLAAFAGIAVLYVGTLHMWGHFFLMTVGPHHALVAYWLWATFGLVAGVCTDAQRQEEFPVANEMMQYASAY